MSLKRERLELSPVYATAVAHGGHTLGYIRLVNFGAHAAADMEKAMDRLEARAPQRECLRRKFPKETKHRSFGRPNRYNIYSGS